MSYYMKKTLRVTWSGCGRVLSISFCFDGFQWPMQSLGFGSWYWSRGTVCKGVKKTSATRRVETFDPQSHGAVAFCFLYLRSNEFKNSKLFWVISPNPIQCWHASALAQVGKMWIRVLVAVEWWNWAGVSCALKSYKTIAMHQLKCIYFMWHEKPWLII